MRLSFEFVLFVGLACAAAQAQQASGSSGATALLAELPLCARKCLLTAVAQSPCAPGNQTCLCTNAPLQDSVTACVSTSCTIKEALFTKKLTEMNCHAPVRDKGEPYKNISITFGTLSGFFVLLRLVFKLFIIKIGLGLDDWAVLATVLAGIPSTVINVHGVLPNGLGKDIWTLRDDQITNFGKFFYILEILYFFQVSLCQPIPFYWEKWDGLHEGTCFDINAMGWSNAAISIVLDIWMLAIPLWQLRALKLHWKKKIGVAAMFIVGTFVTIVSILRLQSLVSFAESHNPTWDQFDVANWSTIEINTGIICACMPSLRLLLVKLFPRVLGGSTNARSQYYMSGADHNRNNTRSGKRNPNLSQSRDGGILYSKSYTVEYQKDQDEASLVRMDNLGPKGVVSTTSSRHSNSSF
ncbi:CFEM domain-containing protein [Apiospora phragmitis]|uniref:CFEM domain-containing protein n=1 Tax=Apiospora phragmitis TaxID=2905665 RepID=A0ABR1WSJ7_9PEZI